MPAVLRALVVMVACASLAFCSVASTSAAISYRSSSSSIVSWNTQWAVNRPAGVEEGDLLLACVSTRKRVPASAPADWTLVREDASSQGVGVAAAQRVYVKQAGASEPSSYTFTAPEPVSGATIVAAYTGVDPVSPVASSSGEYRFQPGSAYARAPGLTVEEQGVLLVGCYGHNGRRGAFPPTGASERADRWSSAYSTLWLGLELSDEELAGTGDPGDPGESIATGERAALDETLMNYAYTIGQLVALRSAAQVVGGGDLPSDDPLLPPQAPGSYDLPAGAVRVSSSTELVAALNSSAPQDIVLADGVYDDDGPFSNIRGHRLYAEHQGGAILTTGLVVGGNSSYSGGLVRGVVFDVHDPAKTLGGGIVHVWGAAGTNAQVLDCVFRGHGVIPFGLFARNPEGLVAQRLEFYGFTDGGLRASDNKLVAYGGQTPLISEISDILIDGVNRPSPGASNGTAEAGLWIGHPVRNGVSRIKVRNVSWSGIETVNNAWNTTYSNLDIDMSGPNQSAGVGIYIEHVNYYNHFTNFRIVGARTGINAEWADPNSGGIAGAHYIAISNGLIDATGAKPASKTLGIYLDEGSDSTTITGVTFEYQNWAAIGAYMNVGANTYDSNDYTGILETAAAISTSHPNSSSP